MENEETGTCKKLGVSSGNGARLTRKCRKHSRKEGRVRRKLNETRKQTMKEASADNRGKTKVCVDLIRN
jgi:hypothetical protein